MIYSEETIPSQIFILYTVFQSENQTVWINTPKSIYTWKNDTPKSLSYSEEKAVIGIADTSGSPLVNEAETTSLSPIPELVERIIVEIFDSADVDYFEYGYKSKFATSLERVIRDYGNQAIAAIQECITSECVESDTLIETLFTLGSMKDNSTHNTRLIMLLNNLLSTSARIRCGAALGLAYLDDPKALVFIRSAIEHETSQSARICLQRVIEQFENIQQNA